MYNECAWCGYSEREVLYLRSLLERLISETRPYCRPSCVDYDVFPVFKEAVEYIKNRNLE